MENKVMENVLIYFYDKYDGRWEDIYKAIVAKEQVDFATANKVGEDYRRAYDVITIISPDYPQEYKNGYYKPPFVIFNVKGGVC